MRHLGPVAGLLALAMAACSGSGQEGAAQVGGEETASANPAAGGPAPEAERPTVAEALMASADQAAFARALQSAGLLGTFAGPINYTVFAPNEAAFAALPAGLRSSLEPAERNDRQIELLSHHVVPGIVTAADMARAIDASPEGRAELATVTGASLRLSREGPAITVEDGAGGRARIIAPDQVQANGVVHGIDAFLAPRG